MTTHLLARRPQKAAKGLELGDGLCLPDGRVHEACGPARHTFAMWLASKLRGPVLWIVQPHRRTQLNAAGIAPFAHPGRFAFVTPDKVEDVLWCMEEGLRAGCTGMVVADLETLPALTPVRRLHLAAEAGGGRPLGLLLTPGHGGAQGVETRWHMAQAPEKSWRLERLRARTAPPAGWLVQGLPGSPALAPAGAEVAHSA
jgi:protein ImuA